MILGRFSDVRKKSIVLIKPFVLIIGGLLVITIKAILSPNFVSAANIISKCGNITASNAYILNQSITSAIYCLNITASNVEIDCNGSTITYDTGGTATQVGIDAGNGSNARTNLTIKDCIIIKPSNK